MVNPRAWGKSQARGPAARCTHRNGAPGQCGHCQRLRLREPRGHHSRPWPARPPPAPRAVDIPRRRPHHGSPARSPLNLATMPRAPIWTLLIAAVASVLLTFTPPAAGSVAGRLGPGPSVTSEAIPPPTAATNSRWGSPLRGPLIVRRGFQPPVQRWSSGHRGVDVAATPGATILAAGAGRVVFAGNLAGRGVVSIEHAPGVRTTYEPVRSTVKAGQSVKLGDIIATFAPDHRHPDSVHWGLRIGDGYADPLTLLRGRPSLKPR
jgi:hypothetical protein